MMRSEIEASLKYREEVDSQSVASIVGVSLGMMGFFFLIFLFLS